MEGVNSMAKINLVNGRGTTKVVKGKHYAFGSTDVKGYTGAVFNPSTFTGGSAYTGTIRAAGTLTLTFDGLDASGVTIKRFPNNAQTNPYTTGTGDNDPIDMTDAANGTVIIKYLPYVEDPRNEADKQYVYIGIYCEGALVGGVRKIEMNALTVTLDVTDVLVSQTLTFSDPAWLEALPEAAAEIDII